MQVVAVDIGGTHARFAIAEVEGGHVLSLGEPVALKTAEHASLQTAWQAFGKTLDRPRRHFCALRQRWLGLSAQARGSDKWIAAG